MQFDHLFNLEPSEETKQKIIDDTFVNYTKHLNPGFIEMKRSAKSRAHSVEWRGEGVYMYDINGHKLIDCLGGYGVFTLGHRHPHVMKRLREAMERIGMYSQELLNPLQAELAKEIAQRAPGGLQYVYYHCGGAESNDAAIKMARLATGREQHVGFTNAFHGKTLGSLTFTARAVLQKPFRPLLPGITRAPYNDIDALPYYITEDTASVIIEAVQGEGGIIVPDTEFLKAVQEHCNKVGALMHVDEVQSGWGRTGKYFCSEHFGIEPDIVTLGKALGAGMFPQSALIANEKAFFGTRVDMPLPKGTPFKGMAENPWWLTNTFAGSQLACACSLASIEAYEKDNLLEACEEKGKYLRMHMAEIVDKHHHILKDVRGLGLWIGLECAEPELGTKLADELLNRDVLVAQTINNPGTLRFQPPLIITQEQLDTVLQALSDSADAVANGKLASSQA